MSSLQERKQEALILFDEIVTGLEAYIFTAALVEPDFAVRFIQFKSIYSAILNGAADAEFPQEVLLMRSSKVMESVRNILEGNKSKDSVETRQANLLLWFVLQSILEPESNPYGPELLQLENNPSLQQFMDLVDANAYANLITIASKVDPNYLTRAINRDFGNAIQLLMDQERVLRIGGDVIFAELLQKTVELVRETITSHVGGEHTQDTMLVLGDLVELSRVLSDLMYRADSIAPKAQNPNS